MSKWSGVFLTLLVGSVVLVMADDGGTAERWSAARAAVDGAEQWVPATVFMTMEFLDRHGDIDDVLRMRIETHDGSDGPTTETTILERPTGIIGALMSASGLEPDGVSSPSGDREAPDSGAAGNRSPGGSRGDGAGGQLANPFAERVQSSVELEALRETDVIGGVPSDGFAISWAEPDGTTYTGTVWLANDSSRPVRLDVEGHSADKNVRDLAIAVSFRPEGALSLPAEVLSVAEYRIALVLRIRVRMSMELADYFLPDNTGADEAL